jgi:hypothetical protein
MHILFNLLRIMGPCMFWASCAHPQDTLHKQYLLYCVRVLSPELECSSPTLVQSTDIILTQYAKCDFFSASWGWANNARNIQRSVILNKLNKMCITLVSLYWYTLLHGRKNINLLKPTGYLMHHQFNIQQLYALSTLYLYVLYLPEIKQRLVPLTS